MPDREEKETLEEIYRLTRENNRMLHAMRRSAFLSGLVRVLFWLIVLGGSYWAYMTFVVPIVEEGRRVMSQVESASANVQTQLGGLQRILDIFPSF